MKIFAWRFFAALACGALADKAVLAQPAAPHIGFVYPAGGQQGTTFTVSVGGQNLNAASVALVSGAGTQARVIGYERPLTQREINDLREESDRLQAKRAAARTDATNPAFTPDDEKRVNEIRTLLATRGLRTASPVIAETVTLEITLAADAPHGERELRLQTPGGLSNPLVFCVSQLPEITAPVVTSTSARPLRDRAPRSSPGAARAPSGTELALPGIVNGQIMPGEVDRFHFTATKGQRLTFVVTARALIPYLADAVPGWFQSTIAILDPHGRELAFADDYRFAPDPILLCEIPADGVYGLEIKDALFRGREDFVYRIAIGELPFITAIFPLGGSIGRRIPVDLTGWNLPQNRMLVDGVDRAPGALLLSVPQDGAFSNPVRFALDAAPDSLATEPNDTTRQALPLSLPAIVNGRMERAGDEDVFRFSGRAGDAIVAEVVARRLGSPLDSTLTLSDENGRTLAANDDAEDKGTGLLTHHADSRVAVTLPADGNYLVRVADTQRQGGSEYGYRLRVGAPRPDFELRVVPSTINVRAGASVPITVHALRRDGFTGEIALALQDAPRGFALSGARIPPNESAVRLTLTAPAGKRDDAPALRLFGRASINGQTVVRAAAPADDLMQAFAYRHLVPAKELRVCVVGQGGTLRVVEPRPVRLSGERVARVRVSVPSAKSWTRVTFELIEPPPGVTVRGVAVNDGIADVTFASDPATAKPGTQGNLILQAYGERGKSGPSESKSPPRPPRVPLGVVPAIPYLIDALPDPAL